jgi:hypothetical protein
LESLEDVSVVCHRWDKIIQDSIPLDIWATDIGFRIGYRFFDRLEEIAKYTIGRLKSMVGTETFPPLKDPEALLILEFVSRTTALTFQTLSNGTANLREMHFGYSSLAFDDISAVPLDLPSLQELSIGDKSFESKEIENGSETIAKNIVGLLQHKFPALNLMRLSTVATRKKTERYIIQLLSFIETHSRTLKQLNISIQTSIQRDAIQDYGTLDHIAPIPDDVLQALDWNKIVQVIIILKLFIFHKCFRNTTSHNSVSI